jgi:hypothetical protein
LRVLHAAGYTWQQSRTWCETGKVTRRRKGSDGQPVVVAINDPKAEEKRDGSSEPTG